MVFVNKNINMNGLYKKNPKVEFHPFKNCFGHLIQTLAYFHVKHVHILFRSNDTILSTLNTNP